MPRAQASPLDVPAWEAITLLRDASIGRLCVIDHGTPLALPVNFKLSGRDDDLRIVMRTSASGLLGQYEGPASFEADRIDEQRNRAWSVVARGSLRHAHGDPTLPDPLPWITGNRYLWLVLDVHALGARAASSVRRRSTASPSSGRWIEPQVVASPQGKPAG